MGGRGKQWAVSSERKCRDRIVIWFDRDCCHLLTLALSNPYHSYTRSEVASRDFVRSLTQRRTYDRRRTLVGLIFKSSHSAQDTLSSPLLSLLLQNSRGSKQPRTQGHCKRCEPICQDAWITAVAGGVRAHQSSGRPARACGGAWRWIRRRNSGARHAIATHHASPRIGAHRRAGACRRRQRQRGAATAGRGARAGGALGRSHQRRAAPRRRGSGSSSGSCVVGCRRHRGALDRPRRHLPAPRAGDDG